MAFFCMIGIHSWLSCKCRWCGQTRDQNHEWGGCKCSRCGKVREQDNDWNNDDASAHHWAGCVCERCGQHRDEAHALLKCACTRCKTIVHEWSSDVCSRCGAIKGQNDTFLDYKNRPIISGLPELEFSQTSSENFTEFTHGVSLSLRTERILGHDRDGFVTVEVTERITEYDGASSYDGAGCSIGGGSSTERDNVYVVRARE